MIVEPPLSVAIDDAVLGTHWTSILCHPRAAVRDSAQKFASSYVSVIDGAKCRDSQHLFTTWAAVLDLPQYFGHNWDALDECMSDYLVTDKGGLGSEFGDRTGVIADTLLIVIEEATAILADEPERLGDLIRLCRDADSAASWSAARRQLPRAKLRLIWQSEPGSCSELRDRLNRAGLTNRDARGAKP